MEKLHARFDHDTAAAVAAGAATAIRILPSGTGSGT
jgi:hypothetical protein